ncbi:hypothetical protein FHW17_000186 [Phyllobacterium sp. P30BS-XVII]|nr:hypothetical protein [Phyllobacterium sp. P30BS-XVII]
MKRVTSAEAVIDAAAHRVLARLPQSGICGGLVEFLVFGIKQAWACLVSADDHISCTGDVGSSAAWQG